MNGGLYREKLVDSVITETSTGSLQFVLSIDVTHFRDGGSWRTVEAMSRRVHLSLHDNAIEYTENKLEAIGWNGDYEYPS